MTPGRTPPVDQRTPRKTACPALVAPLPDAAGRGAENKRAARCG